MLDFLDEGDDDVDALATQRRARIECLAPWRSASFSAILATLIWGRGIRAIARLRAIDAAAGGEPPTGATEHCRFGRRRRSARARRCRTVAAYAYFARHDAEAAPLAMTSRSAIPDFAVRRSLAWATF